MSITDELRKWASVEVPYKYGNQLTAIADRIDAEHERECKEQYACGAEDGISVSIDALVIQTHGFIELPKDADGEFIRIGDVMRLGSVERDLTVLGIGINDERDPDMGVFVREGDDYVWYNARFLRHYHAPTVEDVLREFVQEFIDYATCIDDHEVTDAIEQYAKLLKLVAKYSAAAKYLCGHSHCNECNLDCASFFDDVPSGWDCARMLLDKRARGLGVEVDG